MKISVCVTAYNLEKYIARCLGSILTQKTCHDFEILVGDDGSSDNTCEVIRRHQEMYGFEKIRLFTTSRTENADYTGAQRASANRLKLLAHAQGEYICFVDGDDMHMNEGFFQTTVDILEKYHGLCGCTFNYLAYDGQHAYSGYPATESHFIDSYTYISTPHYIHCGSMMFRNRKSWPQMEFFKKYQLFDDNGITLYMLNFGDLYYHHDYSYVYMQDTGGIWTNANETEHQMLNAIYLKLLRCLAPRRFKTAMVKRHLRNINYVYRKRYSLRKELGEKTFEELLKKSIKDGNRFCRYMLTWTFCTEKQKKFCRKLLRVLNDLGLRGEELRPDNKRTHLGSASLEQLENPVFEE